MYVLLKKQQHPITVKANILFTINAFHNTKQVLEINSFHAEGDIRSGNFQGVWTLIRNYYYYYYYHYYYQVLLCLFCMFLYFYTELVWMFYVWCQWIITPLKIVQWFERQACVVSPAAFEQICSCQYLQFTEESNTLKCSNWKRNCCVFPYLS